MGIPRKVKSDNGAPFNSQNFKEFAIKYGFQHHRVTPLHPQANGTAEAFMKPLIKALTTACTEGFQLRQGLCNFLLNYRSIPHPSKGRSPAEIMFGRKLKTKIPTYSKPENDDEIRKRETLAKRNQKRNADVKRKSKPADLRIGDTVLIRQKPRHKLDTPFNPTPGTLIKKNGFTITVEHNGKQFRRDASHFKPVQTDVQDRRRNVHNGGTIPTPTVPMAESSTAKRFED
ncbi:uncharacterized protein K02A2.6-like [Dreissena polymorpha]|uniref:uncharacterized protein K02A2.6-like n=1 Tax=Dreissena polymorpha TaxID=45954 RepID=UPI002263CAB3|nr:uncharacterized protein K02A2.6-like [Dreissena polymorpha]